MTLSDRIKAPDVPICTDCGINKHHTSEQCTQIRIAKAVLEEANDWLVVVREAAAHQRNRKRCTREGQQRIENLRAKLNLAESLDQQ